jgi:acetyl-CoA carboxylase biotin carboxyl carrier protein
MAACSVADMAREKKSADIVAEMVANVMKVVVAPGEKVEAGDTVVLLESMKMEIPVLVEAPGTIVAVKVSEGDVVQEGDILVTVDL